MPNLHIKLEPAGTTPPTHHPEVLLVTGPIIPIQLEVPPPLTKSLTEAGLPVPAPVSGLGLIDTGASVSCVDSGVPGKLGVKPIGTTTLTGATGSGLRALFPMRLVIPAIQLTLDYQYVTEADLSPLGYVALLGRDFLEKATLIYHGNVGEYALSV